MRWQFSAWSPDASVLERSTTTSDRDFDGD
jgi:hypothetical protein